jgi:hypothetical protein
MPMENVASVLEHGILSHVRVAELPSGSHRSVASTEVQDIRAEKRVPGGRPLHEYANLYVNARNMMMYKITRAGWITSADLVVLRISTDVLDLPGVVIADGNAASGATAFRESPAGLAHVSRERCFAKYWTHPTDTETAMHRREMGAEVLVPDQVKPVYLVGVWVVNDAAKQAFDDMETGLPSEVRAELFFE